MISRSFQHVFLLLLRGYKWLISPILTTLFGPLGMGCRFTPTCSEYAMDAIKHHGPWRGLLLTCHRLSRCHPWGEHGHDPVPRFLSNTPAERQTSCKHGS